MMSGGDDRELSTKENIVWNSVGNFIYLFSQWLLTFVVVRILGYESAGVFSLAMTISTSFYCVANYTMRNYQTSDVNGDYSTFTYIASRYLTCLVAMVACFLFVMANAYGAYTTACVMVFMAFKASDALADVYYGVVQKRMRMDYIGISFAVKGIAELLVFLVALLAFSDLLVALVSITAASFVIVFAYDRRKALAGEHGRGSASWTSVRSLLAVCFPIALYGFLFNTAAQLPRYFLEMQFGTEQLGYYASIAMPVVIVQVCATFIFSPLVTPMAMCLRDGRTGEFFGLFKKAMLFIVSIAAVSMLGFAVLGNWFLLLLFGESIAPYTYLLMPLVACTVLTALAWFLSAVVTIVRKLGLLLASSAVMFAIIVIGSVPFMDWFGLNGASFILALSLVVFSAGCSIALASAFRDARSA